MERACQQGENAAGQSGKDTNERNSHHPLLWETSIRAKGGRGLPGARPKAGTGTGQTGYRRLSRSEFETASPGPGSVRRPVEDTVLRNLQVENLRKAMEELDQEDQNLFTLRYDEKLTLEEIGKVYGVSKMTVSKRLRKLHEELRGSVT